MTKRFTFTLTRSRDQHVTFTIPAQSEAEAEGLVAAACERGGEDPLQNLGDDVVVTNPWHDGDVDGPVDYDSDGEAVAPGQWRVRSPDGIWIDEAIYPTRELARAARDEWVKRYALQGYYATSFGEQIPIEQVADRCAFVRGWRGRRTS